MPRLRGAADERCMLPSMKVECGKGIILSPNVPLAETFTLKASANQFGFACKLWPLYLYQRDIWTALAHTGSQSFTFLTGLSGVQAGDTSSDVLDIVPWTLYAGHCTLDIVRWTMYLGHLTLDMVRWTL